MNNYWYLMKAWVFSILVFFFFQLLIDVTEISRQLMPSLINIKEVLLTLLIEKQCIICDERPSNW